MCVRCSKPARRLLSGGRDRCGEAYRADAACREGRLMEPARSYRIGEIAHHTGVSVETLRYYEKRRLLKVPPRSEGGCRRYSEDVVHQVRFIKQAQSLGLTLDDIQHLVTGQQRRN